MSISKRIRLFKDFVLKRSICEVLPSKANMEITNKCNLDCIMCPRKNMKRKVGDMPLNLFKKIISSYNNLEYVALQLYGEPLMNPNLFEMIKYCKKQGILTEISTNATLLDRNNTDKLLRSGLDYIIFALDGVTPQVYENIRIGAKFENVIENIKYFLLRKSEVKSQIFTVLQCIYMNENKNDIKKFKELWRNQSIDSIRIRQLTYYSSTSLQPKRLINVKSKRPCFWLWHEPNILYNGDVIPCCQDVDGSMMLGNINDAPLLNIWNSHTMKRMRQLHIKGLKSSIPLCKNCNMYQPSLITSAGLMLLNPLTINKLIPRFETLALQMRMMWRM